MAGRSFLQSRGILEDLEAPAQERLRDAEALFSSRRYASTISMAIYSLEIALKVVICKNLNLSHLPEPFAIHQLDQLLIVAVLSEKITRVKRPRGVRLNWNSLLALSRDIEKYRYSSDPVWNEALALKTLRELRDSPNGVLLWLSKQA